MRETSIKTSFSVFLAIKHAVFNLSFHLWKATQQLRTLLKKEIKNPVTRRKIYLIIRVQIHGSMRI